MIGWIVTGGILFRERVQELESGYRKEERQRSKVPWWQWAITAFGALAVIVALFS